MHLHNTIRMMLILTLALLLGGCINASATNPDQPSTEPPPVEATPVVPGTTTAARELTPTGFKTISAGRKHGCIIKNGDKSLWCWGNNTIGQVGTDNIADYSSARPVGKDLLWQNISSGYSHTCGVAITEYNIPFTAGNKSLLHRLYCWGDNSTGAIGYGTPTTTFYIPMLIQDDDWENVSAGNNHTCALRLDKTLWCWGNNSNNQLGHNSAKENSPSQVNNDKDWSSINASDQFTCALKNDQGLWCWGLNNKYQFGNNSVANAATPLLISSGWTRIATGQAHVCGIKADNTLWCWGDNSYGQIGNGTITTQPLPLQVTASGITEWESVATGHQHTCAITLGDKSLWCWGNNETGQLGIGSTSHQPRPVKVSHTSGWLTVTAGESFSCGVDKEEVVHCWGLNNHGQLANAANINTDLPRLLDSSPNWKTIASGYDHSCGLKGSTAPYTLWCGGFNSYGQIGNGSTSNQSKLVQINANNGSIKEWSSLDVGPNHSCAIAISGASYPLFCWGNNDRGQLANNAEPLNVPQHWWPNPNTQVKVGADDWIMIATGFNNSCGIKGFNELWCWGDNSSGQIGNGVINLPSDPPFIPTKINGSWLTVTIGGLANGGGHVCAIKTDGTLWCWGRNDVSQVGNATAAPAPTSMATPTQVGTESNWINVKAGERYTCALKNDTTLWCWGDNGRGQTGAPRATTPPTDYPTTVTSPTQESTKKHWLNFDTGSNFTCAINDDKRLWCWGDNSVKQLTSVAKFDVLYDLEMVQNSPEWHQLTLGQHHGCGILESQVDLKYRTYCWGEGALHQFGDGSAWKPVPQALTIK